MMAKEHKRTSALEDIQLDELALLGLFPALVGVGLWGLFEALEALTGTEVVEQSVTVAVLQPS